MTFSEVVAVELLFSRRRDGEPNIGSTVFKDRVPVTEATALPNASSCSPCWFLSLEPEPDVIVFGHVISFMKGILSSQDETNLNK